MTKEIHDYFMEQYKKADFRVVPGHWPDFRSKQEVDNWIKFIENIFDDAFEAAFNKKACPRCHNSEIEPDHKYCKICGLKLE